MIGMYILIEPNFQSGEMVAKMDEMAQRIQDLEDQLQIFDSQLISMEDKRSSTPEPVFESAPAPPPLPAPAPLGPPAPRPTVLQHLQDACTAGTYVCTILTMGYWSARGLNLT